MALQLDSFPPYCPRFPSIELGQDLRRGTITFLSNSCGLDWTNHFLGITPSNIEAFSEAMNDRANYPRWREWVANPIQHLNQNLAVNWTVINRHYVTDVGQNDHKIAITAMATSFETLNHKNAIQSIGYGLAERTSPACFGYLNRKLLHIVTAVHCVPECIR